MVELVEFEALASVVVELRCVVCVADDADSVKEVADATDSVVVDDEFADAVVVLEDDDKGAVLVTKELVEFDSDIVTVKFRAGTIGAFATGTGFVIGTTAKGMLVMLAPDMIVSTARTERVCATPLEVGTCADL